ncbi:MAG: CPBP family intramembrane metalloprotease [Ghiorsea sp.]|nr:CPBP family intramembrane metalloprotease [Ghiorsea sp.]
MFQHKPFAELPSQFLLFGLLMYIGLELTATMLLTYGQGFSIAQQTVILSLRFADLLGLVFLIWKYQVLTSLGLDKPNQVALLVLLKISAMCLLAVGVLYAVQPIWFTYVQLPSWLYGMLGLLLMVVLAPIVEEIIFRGLLYRMLRERWGVGVSVLVSAAFFSLVHHGLLLSPQLVGGVIFALAYEWSRSLWIAIGLHMGANAAVYVLSILY